MDNFLTESKRLNIAVILLAIIFIVHIFFGILYLSYLEPGAEGYYVRMTGVTMIDTSIMNIFILYFSFRNKEKWAWILFLIIGSIYYAAVLIGRYSFEGISVTFIISSMIALVYIIALGISYKEFFPTGKIAMGKILTDSKRLNTAIIIFIILLIYAIYLGILYLSYREPGIGGYIIRMTGLNMILGVIRSSFILYFGFRNKEKWTWIIFLITGLISTSAVLIGRYSFEGITDTFIILSVRYTVYMIAIVISYKEFFPKTKNVI